MIGRLDAAVRDLDRDIGLDDLRRRVFLVFIAATLLAPWGLMFAFSDPERTEDWLVFIAVAFYVVAGVAYLVSRWNTGAGSATLAIGLLALANGMLWIAPPLAWVIYLTPLLVIFASTFWNPVGNLVAAAAISVDLLLVHSARGPITSESLSIIVALAWANVLLTWLAAEPTRLALRWSWSEFQRAEREADRARRHQAELARLVKSLNLAQDRLAQVNHELDRARQAADEARRIKAEFAATVSHELRTPLNLIIGFSEMMAVGADAYGDQPLPPTYQRDVDTIYRNARHLSSLIDDILDLSQIDASRMGLLRERIALPHLVREATAVVEPLFQRKGLSLTADVPDNLPPLTVDRTRIRQVLVNLLSNAARFTVVGGVRIRAWLEDHEVIVAVADTGPGIPLEELPAVFEEFHQVRGVEGYRSGNSGLGLTISKRLVELHGGSMWAESQPGLGSTFYFSLPVAENVASVPLRRDWETWARTTGQEASYEKLIVVYDQNDAAARLLQRHLDGYRAVAVSSVAEVRHLQEHHPVHAVALTGPTELEIRRRAQQLRAQLSELPIVICPLPGRRDLARGLGVVDYLVKPVLREHLARALRRNGRYARDVLVIDDDPDMVDLLVRMVRSISRRTRVRGAYGGADGLSALRAHQPELVILDLLMADLDGYAVLQTMRADEALRDIPVVVVTARGNEEEVVTAGMVGITRGVGLSFAEVIRVLKTSLDGLNVSPTRSDSTPPAAFPE